MRDRIVLGLIAVLVAVVMLGWMIVNPWFPPMTTTPARQTAPPATVTATVTVAAPATVVVSAPLRPLPTAAPTVPSLTAGVK